MSVITRTREEAGRKAVRALILRTLRRHRGVVAAAAAELQVERSNLYVQGQSVGVDVAAEAARIRGENAGSREDPRLRR